MGTGGGGAGKTTYKGERGATQHSRGRPVANGVGLHSVVLVKTEQDDTRRKNNRWGAGGDLGEGESE